MANTPQTRRDLALAIIALVGIVSISAIFYPTGMDVLQRLLPVLMFVLGRSYPSE